MSEESSPADVLTLLLVNQRKIMAQTQVILMQQARLIEAMTGHPTLKVMEQADELYRQELNKLHLASLSELRGLQGLPRSENSGGGLQGAG